jgi:hypothetical protein
VRVNSIVVPTGADKSNCMASYGVKSKQACGSNLTYQLSLT